MTAVLGHRALDGGRGSFWSWAAGGGRRDGGSLDGKQLGRRSPGSLSGGKRHDGGSLGSNDTVAARGRAALM